MTCPHCQDTGWVCEAHPDKAFEGLTDSACDCGGAGMLCGCARGKAVNLLRGNYPLTVHVPKGTHVLGQFDWRPYARRGLNFGPELT